MVTQHRGGMNGESTSFNARHQGWRSKSTGNYVNLTNYTASVNLEIALALCP